MQQDRQPARTHKFFDSSGMRRFGVVLTVLLFLVGFAAPAGADPDGYTDNFPGDAVFTFSTWDQGSGGYKVFPPFTQVKAGDLRTTFDTAWNNLQSTFCDQLEAGIKAGDGSWVKRNHCTPVPAAQAELRAKNLGPNLLGLRYFIPGHDAASSIYAYDHDSIVGDVNIDVRFDLTIDVVLRVANGVGSESDTSTPLTVQSATLSFSRAHFSATVCTDDCAAGEQKLNSVVLDIANQIDLTGSNNEIHTSLQAVPGYEGLNASLSATAANFSVLHDTLPALDPAKPLATMASVLHLGLTTIPQQSVYGVDTSGALWQQTSLAGLPYQHWLSKSKPTGTSLGSGVSATLDTTGTPNVFATGANGNLYQFNGTSWLNRGHPAGTTAVGTPAAAANAGLARVVVRTGDGRIAVLVETAPNTFTWVDLGHPNFTPIGVTPAIVVAGPYIDVIVTRTNGGIMSREAYGPYWGAWHDIGTLPSPATTPPSAIWNGTYVSVFVTALDHSVVHASWKPLQAASIGRLGATLTGSLPPVTSAPSAALQPNGLPVVFASDANGELWRFTYVNKNAVLTGYVAADTGTLLGTTMGAPLAVPATTTAFAVAANQHLGEVHVSGVRLGLIDHNALSRVTVQAHTSHYKGGGVWSGPVQEGQTANAKVGFIVWPPDAFRVQSTFQGSVTCQAYADGIGWLPAVNDSQPCGAIGHNVDAIRFVRTDSSTATHVLYRCFAGAWSAWLADGMPCGASGLAHNVTSVQVQLSDAGLSGVSYRAQSADVGWQPWTSEGALAGTPGKQVEGLEVASNVGGELRCQPLVQDIGPQDQVQDNDGLCGTVGESKRLEGFTLILADGPPGVGVQYRSFVHNVGWGPWCVNGQLSGGPGQQIDQVQVQLTHSP